MLCNTKWREGTVEEFTKRTILFQTAQIFDPLGLVGLIVIIFKLLLQKLWQLKFNWDESFAQDIHTDFASLLQELSDTPFLIPRYILGNADLNYEAEHGFSDASEAT